jgi:hypothetical protein
MSWRDVLSIHPAAELLPRIPEDELKALGDDIKKYGLRNKVAILDDQLLDGISRLDAMEMAGMPIIKDGAIDPDIVEPVSGVDPNAYVLSQNLHRRHLSSEQKREFIAKLLKANPEASNKSIGKQAKVDDKTVGKVRDDLEGRSEIPHTKTRKDTKGRSQSAQKPKDDAGLDYFTERVCDLIEKITKHPPKRFAKTGVEAEQLAKLGQFFNALAKLVKARPKAGNK